MHQKKENKFVSLLKKYSSELAYGSARWFMPGLTLLGAFLFSQCVLSFRFLRMEDSDDDIAVMITAYSHLEHEAAQFAQRVVKGDCKVVIRTESADPDQSLDGPGRVNAKEGFKSQYQRSVGQGEQYYWNVRNHPNPTMLNNHTGYTIEEFDELFLFFRAELTLPIDPRLEYSREIFQSRERRRRLLPDKVILFLFLHLFRGGNEGGIGLEHLFALYGISSRTFSNYIRHFGYALLHVLKGKPHSEIVWPDSDTLASMHGLVYGFPNCVAFVDGTKQQSFRPKDKDIQEKRYDGHHHLHCFSVLLWTDIYGVIIRLDSTLEGSRHDREIYNDRAPYRQPQNYFSQGEHAIWDTGFQRAGDHIVCPMKWNQGRKFQHRYHMNRDIRKQRIRNEWAVGLISNRFRLFLGRC